MNSTHNSPSTQAHETNTDSENSNNDQDMGIKEYLSSNTFNEDASPGNGNKNSESPTFKAYYKKIVIIWGNKFVNPESCR